MLRRLLAITGGLVVLLAPAANAAVDPYVAAAGDIACSPSYTPPAPDPGWVPECEQAETAGLVQSQSPTALLTLGDVQYESGTLAEFTGTGAFDQTWGQIQTPLHPALGNHEYNSSPGTGYFDYFNGVGNNAGPAGRRGDGWYSYDLGVWHVISLNSSDNCNPVSCAAGSAQEQWLKSDLAGHSGQCTLAYWHHARFSSGQIGNNAKVAPFWDDLYAAHADVVLNGHDHDYERFVPQDPSGVGTTDGIREFVVGTGGRSAFDFTHAAASTTAVRFTDLYGVLFLALHQGSYDWKFLRAPDGAVLDSGSSQCRRQPPVAQTDESTGVSSNAAGVVGAVNGEGQSAGYHFEWGTTTAYGSSTPEGSSPADAQGHVVDAQLSGLAAGTTYHYRLVAHSPAGDSFGSDRTFTTAPAPPAAAPAPAAGSLPGSAVVTRPLTLTSAMRRVQSLAALLRKGLQVRVGCSLACTVKVEVFIDATRKAARISAGKVAKRLAGGRTATVRVRLGRRARRLLATGRFRILRVRVQAGSRSTTRSVRLSGRSRSRSR